MQATRPNPTTLTPWQHHRLEDRLDAALRRRLRRCPAATDLIADTTVLSSLQELCGRDRAAYQRLVAARRPALGLWLWQLALAVAAAGWPVHALGLLDALPGVCVGGEARMVLEVAAADVLPCAAAGGQ